MLEIAWRSGMPRSARVVDDPPVLGHAGSFPVVA